LKLRDTVATVVGATGGIGAAVAEALGAEGSRLALVGRDETRLAKVSDDLGRHGIDRATFTCDLEHAAEVESCVRRVEERFSRIDVLAVCAGNAKRGGIDAVTDADFESTLQVKLMGPIRLVRAALPGMRARRYGRIILIGGLGGRNPSGDAVVGGAVNAGMANFGRQIAKAFAAEGVTVNVVDPHHTRTARWEKRLDELQRRHGISREEASARASSHLPIGRPVEPGEIADLVVFLASRRASAINGAVIPVDGGSAEGLY
jgi:NAD(P)-dependent dehydrogenase (short-subunit alcohol dehydrogenase family)